MFSYQGFPGGGGGGHSLHPWLVEKRTRNKVLIVIVAFFSVVDPDPGLKRGILWSFFFMYIIQHGFSCRPSDSTLSEDAGIEPRTVAT